MTYRFNQSAISSCIAVTLCYGRYSKVGVGVERIFQNSKGSVRRILPGCDGRAQGTNIDSQTLLQIHVEVSNLARVSVQAEAESTRKQLWRTGHARLSSWRSEAHSSLSRAGGSTSPFSGSIPRTGSIPPRPSQFPVMSQTPAKTVTSSNFQAIFQAALKSYQKQTKSDLIAHPLASQLKSCNSTTAILTILQDQVQEFDKSRNGDERLTKWLGPTVNVLSAFSAAVSGGVSLVGLGS